MKSPYYECVEMVSAIVKVGGMRPTPPASKEEIESLCERSIRLLGYSMPKPYIEFISLMDGFYKSSMQLYASRQRPLILLNGKEHPSVWIDDVVKMTLELRADLYHGETLILLARDSADRGWDPVRGEWFRRYVDGGGIRIYRSFLEMIADGLWAEGVDVRHLMPRDFQFSSLDAAGQPVSGTRT